MIVSQYAYFAVTSSRVPAAEITARLGIEPDEIVVRGSRNADPATPARHRWKVACRKPGLTVDDQIARIVDRLFEHAGRIGELAVELDLMAGRARVFCKSFGWGAIGRMSWSDHGCPNRRYLLPKPCVAGEQPSEQPIQQRRTAADRRRRWTRTRTTLTSRPRPTRNA